MEIIRLKINGNEYRMFEITVFRNTPHEQTVIAAEEKLNTLIENNIGSNGYDHTLKSIDEKFSYWIPQAIADDELESEIVDSIESVMKEDIFM